MQTPVSLFSSGQKCSKSGGSIQLEDRASTSALQSPVAEVSERPAVEVAADDLAGLAAKAAGCRLCELADTRTEVVFGAGNPNADVLFIGEAPGRDEDLKGEPFVGRAGQLLDRMLSAIDMSRENVYIMNTIKCRPPNNRDPRVDEVQACSLWFEQQIELLQPKVICLLGRVAAQTVLETDAALAALRGHWHDYKGIPVWVTYHPAYLLRSPQQKQKSWSDLQVLSSRYSALQ